MFRRAIITDEVSQDPADAVRLARRFGLDGLEVRSVWEKGPHELTREQIRVLRGMARSADLTVCAVATPVFKCPLGAREVIRDHAEILRRCLDLAGELEAPLARVFTFWKPDAPGAPADAGAARSWEGARSMIADHLVAAAEIARHFGVRLVVENEPSVYASTCAQVADLLDRIAHPYLGAVWDPGNSIYVPEGEVPYPDGYDAITRHLSHVHVKDARRSRATGAPEAVLLGDGAVGYRDVFRRLIDDGYAGVASLETHYRAAALSADAARLPGGRDFSAGGYEASLACLDRWFEMLAALGAPVAPPEEG